MPDAFLLTLRRLNNAPLPVHAGDVVHAAFYELLARGDADLAERLHAANARKPFTVYLLPPDPAAKPQHPHPQSKIENRKSKIPTAPCASPCSTRGCFRNLYMGC